MATLVFPFLFFSCKRQPPVICPRPLPSPSNRVLLLSFLSSIIFFFSFCRSPFSSNFDVRNGSGFLRAILPIDFQGTYFSMQWSRTVTYPTPPRGSSGFRASWPLFSFLRPLCKTPFPPQPLLDFFFPTSDDPPPFVEVFSMRRGFYAVHTRHPLVLFLYGSLLQSTTPDHALIKPFPLVKKVVMVVGLFLDLQKLRPIWSPVFDKRSSLVSSPPPP